MKPYFESADRLAALVAISRSWNGTPFMKFGKVKGAGVDCVHLAGEIYCETGHLKEYNFGSYTLDGGHHNELSQVTAWLDANPRFIKGVYPPLAGDLLCFRIGKSVHHVGLVINGRQFVHVVRGGNVSLARIDEPTWLKRLAGIYRPVES